MEKRKALILTGLFLASNIIGLAIGLNLPEDSSGNKYSEVVSHTVNSENEIQRVEFDNRSIELMYEDSQKARAYIDLDMDGSSDREIDMVNDGEERNIDQILTFGQKSYRLYFRYSDNENKSSDGYLSLYRITEIQ